MVGVFQRLKAVPGGHRWPPGPGQRSREFRGCTVPPYNELHGTSPPRSAPREQPQPQPRAKRHGSTVARHLGWRAHHTRENRGLAGRHEVLRKLCVRGVLPWHVLSLPDEDVVVSCRSRSLPRIIPFRRAADPQPAAAWSRSAEVFPARPICRSGSPRFFFQRVLLPPWQAFYTPWLSSSGN